MVTGAIKGRQLGHEWRFTYTVDAISEAPADPISTRLRADGPSTTTPAVFEAAARLAMSRYFNVALSAGQVPGVPKIFDLMSEDRRIVGDAKYYTLVQDERTPPAKFSVIAEHVWLLEKTQAQTQFLVFGNDRRVPEKWLAKYGVLARRCDFYFLTAENQLQRLEATR